MHTWRKAIQLYLEENSIGRIESIIKVALTPVTNQAKIGVELEKIPKKDNKVDILELNELCRNKKHLALDCSNLATKRLVGFHIGTRETKYSQKLSNKISYIDAKFFDSNYSHTYKIIAPAKHLIGKAYTSTADRLNRFLRHYLE